MRDVGGPRVIFFAVVSGPNRRVPEVEDEEVVQRGC